MDTVYKKTISLNSVVVLSFLLCFFCVLVLFTGCDDLTSGRRPGSYGGTWISEEPYISLVTGKANSDSSEYYAEMDINGEIREVFVLFPRTSSIKIYSNMIISESRTGLGCYYPPEDLLISGDCAFLPDWFEIYSIKEDNVYNGKYKSIKFYRHED